jgi:transposase
MEIQARAILAQLTATCQAADSLPEHATQLFDTHPQAAIYLSVPGLGPILACRLLAEIGDDPQRFSTPRGLKAYAGASPLTWASGKSRTVLHRRFGANTALAEISHLWAFASLRASPGARAYGLLLGLCRPAVRNQDGAVANLNERRYGCFAASHPSHPWSNCPNLAGLPSGQAPPPCARGEARSVEGGDPKEALAGRRRRSGR